MYLHSKSFQRIDGHVFQHLELLFVPVLKHKSLEDIIHRFNQRTMFEPKLCFDLQTMGCYRNVQTFRGALQPTYPAHRSSGLGWTTRESSVSDEPRDTSPEQRIQEAQEFYAGVKLQHHATRLSIWPTVHEPSSHSQSMAMRETCSLTDQLVS